MCAAGLADFIYARTYCGTHTVTLCKSSGTDMPYLPFLAVEIPTWQHWHIDLTCLSRLSSFRRLFTTNTRPITSSVQPATTFFFLFRGKLRVRRPHFPHPPPPLNLENRPHQHPRCFRKLPCRVPLRTTTYVHHVAPRTKMFASHSLCCSHFFSPLTPPLTTTPLFPSSSPRAPHPMCVQWSLWRSEVLFFGFAASTHGRQGEK